MSGLPSGLASQRPGSPPTGDAGRDRTDAAETGGGSSQPVWDTRDHTRGQEESAPSDSPPDDGGGDDDSDDQAPRYEVRSRHVEGARQVLSLSRAGQGGGANLPSRLEVTLPAGEDRSVTDVRTETVTVYATDPSTGETVDDTYIEVQRVTAFTEEASDGLTVSHDLSGLWGG